ncbi:MAG: hypothetical protein WBQ25_00455 [Nitrososphaeraceae archaeon]
MQPSKEKDKKKDKTKTTQKAADIEVTIHQKIQLWTNEQENEFALRLAISPTDDNNLSSENSFLATTDPNSRYVHPVAESDYLEDLKHGWDYTLRHFIEEYKQTLKQQQNIQRNRKRPRMAPIDPTPSSPEKVVKDQVINDGRNIERYDDDYYYPVKLIPHIKCHYCNLHFHNEKERKEHELELHV